MFEFEKPPINVLMHYGTPRHSGRYPWGSGDNPYQRNATFLYQYREMHANGKSDAEIAEELGITTTQLRAKKSIATSQERNEKINRVMKLKKKGYSNVKIGEMMTPPIPESSVRAILKQAEDDRVNETKKTADILAKNVNDKKYIDVGVGVEREIGVTQTKLNTAIAMLEEDGYQTISVRVPQATMRGQFTTVKVLAPPGVDPKEVRKEIYNDFTKVQSITEYSSDNGKSFNTLEEPKSLDSSRVFVRYGDEGGADRDGTIEIRRGVDDISLGSSSYAQVRILVDGNKYMKGMAFYSDNIPEGYDIIYNSNKTKDKADKVFKKVEEGADPMNPFGAAIKANGQVHYTDKNGNDTIGVINKIKAEGDWDNYSRNLASQFLSKQSLQLIKSQLNLSYADKEAEYDEIMSIQQKTVKKKLLMEFADNCDAAAVDLKAAALPGQSSKVILPITSLKDNEVYAPTYENGTRVCLVRYPHGGTFEIPELVVNNNQKEAKRTLGNVRDAIGININAASKLSGADFDGDTVVVIPLSSKVQVKSKPALEGLKNFSTTDSYPGYDGMKVMTKRTHGLEMGKVSNLITDMTLRGASDDELERAVKHSMVVVDAYKHELDYKRSEEENRIGELRKKYQGKDTGGASTLISRAKSETRVAERSYVKGIDPETGEKIWALSGKVITTRKIDKNGNEVIKERPATTKSTKLAETKDARTLSSGTPQEEAYADYSNKLKALANTARKQYISIKEDKPNETAKKTYAKEVSSLDAKLNDALKNAPKERKAQMIAASTVKNKVKDDPTLKDDSDEYMKVSNQALASARARVGASKKDVQVQITDNEWAAIQAGAISASKLTKILNNSDSDLVRKLATPKTTVKLSSAKQNKIKALSRSGYSIAEIAEELGISSSTVSNYIK